MVKPPKVVIFGAGSLFFGRQAIWQMIHSKHLNKGTLSLVDTDESRLLKMVKLAKMVAAENNVPLLVEGSTERKDVLAGADFVVLSFADRSVKFRGIDCELSAKYGIRMCSGDTIGPGGIFRTMREFPVILECAKDIEKLCPEAWVINYINPAAVHGIGLKKYAPGLKSFALCDGLHMPRIKKRYAVRAGIIKNTEEYTAEIDREFDMRIAGVNHFTWMIKAEYKGCDVAPKIAESLRIEAAAETDGGDSGSKASFNSTIGYQLYEIFGYVPTCVGHTKEYLPYWQGLGKTGDMVPPLSLWDTNARYKRHEEMWKQVEGFIEGTIPISTFMKSFGPDHATDIIESMVSCSCRKFYINTFNNGAVSNMTDNAFLELCCEITAEGPKPLPVGEMPAGIRGLQQLVLDTHELTADAVAKCDFSLLRRAMLTDPLVHSIRDADTLIRELMAAERDALPASWFEAD